MKTKERSSKKPQKSTKQTKPNPLSDTNVDYDEVKKKLNQGNMLVAEPIRKTTRKGPSKTQINRLKQFYNTTRWLPNSAFTTYFGKPAFENYGYGNTNPVYGGLFYGNYMLSHNMNPIDGANHPEEKQVYSSAMMKRLQEIRTRKQIFQLPNNFPSRDIIPPNLLKARYFRSGKNTPENSEDENEEEYEDWNIENVLSGKKNKKMKINKRAEGGFNPYSQGRVELKKKKMKEGLDNKFSNEFYKKANAKHLKNKGINNQYDEGEEDFEESEGQLLYEKQREYYLKMLGEEKVKNIEDLSHLEVQKKNEETEQINTNLNSNENNKESDIKENNNEINNLEENNEHNCQVVPLTEQIKQRIPCNPLKKKENPALLPPNFELVKNKDNAFVCCVHHSKMPVTSDEKDPRNYQGMPPCMMAEITPAGKPSHIVAPLNIFANDNY